MRVGLTTGERGKCSSMTTAQLFDTFKETPELVAITVRREIAGRWWDIALTCDFYGRRDAPGAPKTAYYWEARRCAWESDADDVDGFDFAGDSAWTSPEAALADAFEQLPELLAEREEEIERRIADKRRLLLGPHEGGYHA